MRAGTTLPAMASRAPGEGFAGHEISLYQPGVTDRQDGGLAGEPRTQGCVVAELDSSLMLASVVRAGLALGELPEYLARRDPELVRVWPERRRAEPYEAWLLLHQDLASTARVRSSSKRSQIARTASRISTWSDVTARASMTTRPFSDEWGGLRPSRQVTGRFRPACLGSSRAGRKP